MGKGVSVFKAGWKYAIEIYNGVLTKSEKSQTLSQFSSFLKQSALGSQIWFGTHSILSWPWTHDPLSQPDSAGITDIYNCARIFQNKHKNSFRQSQKVSHVGNQHIIYFFISLKNLGPKTLHKQIMENRILLTWQDHFDEISFLDITCHFHQLEDVFRGRIMPEKQDLII